MCLCFLVDNILLLLRPRLAYNLLGKGSLSSVVVFALLCCCPLIFCNIWLWTNGVNTNGVTAKILFLDGFEQVLNMYCLDMTECCMQPSPSRRNSNRGSQPMRPMLGKQRCMPYACARWFPCVRRCMDMYGYMSMDECLHTQSQTRTHTYM